jgi:hypothetical protein
LRQLWKFLQSKPVRLCRAQRRDLHDGRKDVLEVSVLNPLDFDELFKEVSQIFPDLLYYDVDIPLILRYAATFGVFPLGRCQIKTKMGWEISEINPLDTPWELDPRLPHLRVMEIRPDADPAHVVPKQVFLHFDRFKYCLDLDQPRKLLSCLTAALAH